MYVMEWMCFVDKNVKLLHVGDTEIFSSSSANSQNDEREQIWERHDENNERNPRGCFDEIVLSQLSLGQLCIIFFWEEYFCSAKTHLEICLPPIFEIVHLVVHLHFHWIHLIAELRGEGWARMDWIVLRFMFFFLFL